MNFYHCMVPSTLCKSTYSAYIQISLVDVWLRTDLEASWGKLALALTEAEEITAAGRVKEEFLGVPASSPSLPLHSPLPDSVVSLKYT